MTDESTKVLRPKVRFANAVEARRAVIGDKLACVYVRADRVFVVTAHGTGEFSRADWEAAK